MICKTGFPSFAFRFSWDSETIKKFERKLEIKTERMRKDSAQKGFIRRNPGSKITILQDFRRILTRTSCKSLQESSNIASKTAYKISCEDVLLRHLTKILGWYFTFGDLIDFVEPNVFENLKWMIAFFLGRRSLFRPQ